jgi:carbamoyltransferase
MSYLIGVHYGHNATVCVMCDGDVIFYQSEERFNRLKNSTGFPEQTLDYVYNNICDKASVKYLAFSQNTLGGYRFMKQSNFESRQYGHYLSPENNLVGFFKTNGIRWALSQFFQKRIKDKNKKESNEAKKYFMAQTGLKEEQLVCVDHHTCHALSAVPLVASDDKEYLIFTADAVGDYISSTVSTIKNTNLTWLSRDDHKNSLGYFYSAITSLLGMKAGEHEFKVMGLAPYSNFKYFEPIYLKLKKLLKIDVDGAFKSALNPNQLHNELGKMIKHQRFDNVAGAIQMLTESLLKEWVLFWIQKTGVKRILVSGGVMMNVKACQVLAELSDVEEIHVVPSAADESTALGAAVYLTHKCRQQVKSMRHLYLGIEHSDAEIIEAITGTEPLDCKIVFDKPKNIAKEIALLLAKNEVVARCAGPMEFGARALGNRSILANPSDFSTVEEINATIKARDFWMPFTPSILSEDMDRYIKNPKKIPANYMSITFDTTEEARRDLKAAIHPRDKTARPQCVYKEWNKDYHQIINEFKQLTGIGAVLNTSFNLHGEPNVCSPKDAMHTFLNSDLNYMVLGPYLVEKRKKNNNEIR